jgi:RNase H-fold protein (predicted Holliday junction resolvase)
MLLGFDPGRDKCGVAVMGRDRQVYFHDVVLSESAIAALQLLLEKYAIDLMVMGDQTTSKQWKEKIRVNFPPLKIVQVDERYSSLEARDRFWKMYPPKGFSRLIPEGMRTPPRPIDDIVAIILMERYLDKK